MSGPHVMTQDEVKQLVAGLVDYGDWLESRNSPRWFEVARAAATLEGVRLGVIAIAPLYQPRREVAHV